MSQDRVAQQENFKLFWVSEKLLESLKEIEKREENNRYWGKKKLSDSSIVLRNDRVKYPDKIGCIQGGIAKD